MFCFALLLGKKLSIFRPREIGWSRLALMLLAFSPPFFR